VPSTSIELQMWRKSKPRQPRAGLFFSFVLGRAESGKAIIPGRRKIITSTKMDETCNLWIKFIYSSKMMYIHPK